MKKMFNKLLLIGFIIFATFGLLLYILDGQYAEFIIIYLLTGGCISIGVAIKERELLCKETDHIAIIFLWYPMLIKKIIK